MNILYKIKWSDVKLNLIRSNIMPFPFSNMYTANKRFVTKSMYVVSDWYHTLGIIKAYSHLLLHVCWVNEDLLQLLPLLLSLSHYSDVRADNWNAKALHFYPLFRIIIQSSVNFHNLGPVTLRWRQNGRDSVSNHQPRHCLLSLLFGRRSKKTSKLRVTGLCVGNSPGPVNFPHKGPVTRKMFPFDDVIMNAESAYPCNHHRKIKMVWIFITLLVEIVATLWISHEFYINISTIHSTIHQTIVEAWV